MIKDMTFSDFFETEDILWQEVEKIWKDNDNFPKKVAHGRNLHHKMPRAFYKKMKVAVDNSPENLVSLSLGDHLKIHWLYWKCAKKGYRSAMALAFRMMYRKAAKYVTWTSLEKIASDYDLAAKDYKTSAETRAKLSASHKGHHYSAETRAKLSASHKGHHHSAETRAKMSASAKNRPHLSMSDETRAKIGAARKGKNNPMYGKHWHLDENGKRVPTNLTLENYYEEITKMDSGDKKAIST